MKTSLKENNKGFSLVELIVVIAIMGILAVTLAPRLSQYVERARQASDREAVGTIFTAAKLANLEDPKGLVLAAQFDEVDDADFVLGDKAAASLSLFNVTDDTDWAINDSFDGVADPATENNVFVDTLQDILGDFELKSSEVVPATTITINSPSTGKVAVTLDYDGDGVIDDNDVFVTE